MNAECSVCLTKYTNRNIDQCIQCQCGFEACRECCLTYALPSCMKCNTHFTKQFCKKFNILTLFKSYHEKLTWEREFSLLASTQPFLDWEDTVAKLKKRLRFGERVLFPEKPKMFLNSSTTNPIFACPGSECRGFVGGSHCGTCKKEVCAKCREFVHAPSSSVPSSEKEDNTTEPQKRSIYASNNNNNNNSKLKAKHVCDPLLLASITSIAQEAKSCPRCRAQIFRIEGCNHMFCTNCRTHFDWETNRVLTSSSNHHYDLTTAFSTNVAILSKNSNSENTEQCSTDPFTDAIPSSVVSSPEINQDIFRALWKEPISARFLLRKRLSAFETEFQYQESLLRIRLMFLRGQVTEDQAKSRVLQEDEKHEKMFRQRSLLEMYLNICNDLQRMVYVNRNQANQEDALRIYKNLIDTCQAASRDTKSELGGECLGFSCDFASQMPHVTL